MNEKKEEKPDLVAIPEEEKKPKNDKKKLRKKLLLVIGGIVGVLLVILIILLVIQLLGGKTLSFEQIELKMESAAREYYKVQKDLLPQEEGGKDSVDASVLSEGEYMKPLSNYTKEGISCTGEVQVSKVNGRYVYTPHLDCGKAYQTKELYQAVIEQGVITAGYGLYQLGQSYVYRGETVNNYVSFANTTWRIIKVTSKNQVLLILDDPEYMPSLEWDNRYNQKELSRTGINTYHVSRIKEALQLYYKNTTDDTVTFREEDQDKLVTFSICVGAREENYAANDHSRECSLLEENQIIGLLPVSDYLNASADPNCHATVDKSCQNYNYLRIQKQWWLATPNAKDTKSIYYVSGPGNVQTAEAISNKCLRPVIMMGDTIMIQGGDGSSAHPFVLK